MLRDGGSRRLVSAWNRIFKCAKRDDEEFA